VWRNLREGRESQESAAITKACPSREEEPLKRKWEALRFGSNRTSCVHNLSLDLRPALPTRHNHCSCQHPKILQTLKHGGSTYLQSFGMFGDQCIVKYLIFENTAEFGPVKIQEKIQKYGSKSVFVHKQRFGTNALCQKAKYLKTQLSLGQSKSKKRSKTW